MLDKWKQIITVYLFQKSLIHVMYKWHLLAQYARLTHFLFCDFDFPSLQEIWWEINLWCNPRFSGIIWYFSRICFRIFMSCCWKCNYDFYGEAFFWLCLLWGLCVFCTWMFLSFSKFGIFCAIISLNRFSNLLGISFFYFWAYPLNFNHCFSVFLIFLFSLIFKDVFCLYERHSFSVGEPQEELPSTSSLPTWPQWPGLGEIEPRVSMFLHLSHVGLWSQGFGPFSTAFPLGI